MKKLIFSILTFCILLASGFTSHAASSGPADGYDPYSATAPGAWSYIKVYPTNGQRSRTHYLYSNYESTTPPIEGTVEEVSGYSYSKKSNTLIITGVKEDDLILEAHNMGTGFAISFKGSNVLRSIKVTNENWDSGLTLSGNVTLGSSTDHSNVPLDVDGNLTITGGTIKCLAEVTDIQSSSGLRYSVLARNSSSTPFRTALKWKGELKGTESAAGITLASSKDNITFSGKALKTPSVKRSGKKLS